MTAKEKIEKLVSEIGPTPNTIDGMLVFAYYLGRETVARELCDEHNRRIERMTHAAMTERYFRVALRAIAPGSGEIYSDDYAQDVTNTFGSDEAP